MITLQDCKKGQYIKCDLYREGFDVLKILHVGKVSITINKKVNWGTGMLGNNRPHNYVLRGERLQEHLEHSTFVNK